MHMIELRLNNSFSQITGLSTKQYGALRKILSYQSNPRAAYFRGGFNYTRYLIDKKGNFPSGLGGKVLEYILSQNVPHLTTCLYKRPTASRMHFLRLGSIVPYHDQEKAAAEAARVHRGTVSMVTGYGKSITMALLINKLQVKTLVIVPNLELKRQLSETFTKVFGSLKNITVENIDSSNLKKCIDYDCLIIDEVHHAAARTYHKLNKTAWGKIYYRFGFTATAFRNQDEEQILLESIAGLVIYKVGYKQAVAQGAIVPIEAYYYEISKVRTEAFTWREVYDELVVGNGYRNALIADLLMNLEAAGTSALCLVKEIEHGKILSDMTELPFVSGQDEESKDYITMFNKRKINVLIGTVGVVGEGVDTKPCEFVIIAGLGKARSNLMQSIGRCVRKYQNKTSGKVILLMDKSHKFCLQHFKAQVKVIKEEFGADVLKLEV